MWKERAVGWRVHVYNKDTGVKIGIYDLARRDIKQLRKELEKPDALRARSDAAASTKPGDNVAALIDTYQSMKHPAYAQLGDRTRRDYDNYLRALRTKFGSMKKVALNAPGVRKLFKAWRDELADKPRAADMRMIVLDWVMKQALDDREIEVNHASGIGRLYRGAKDVNIWSEDDFEIIKANAPAHVWRVIRLAELTGARLSALLALSPANLDGNWLEYDPQKKGRIVRIPLDDFPELKAEIDVLPKDQLRLLLNSRGRPWTLHGFETSMRKVKLKAERKVTFHGLRRTAITRWFDKISSEKIALITGHSLKYVSEIIDRHYVKRSRENARVAVRALNENSTKGTTKGTTRYATK